MSEVILPEVKNNTITVGIIDKDKDYPVFCDWWRGHGWNPPPKVILPKYGAVAKNSKGMIAAVWAYMDNSVGVAWLEWLVTDPKAGALTSIKAITYMVACVEETLKEEFDYGVIMTTCKQPALVRLFERLDYKITDRKMTHLFKIMDD